MCERHPMCKVGTAKWHIRTGLRLSLLMVGVLAPLAAFAQAQDPGVRKAASDGGSPPSLAGLTGDEQTFFHDGLTRFQNVETVSGRASTRTSAHPATSSPSSAARVPPRIR